MDKIIVAIVAICFASPVLSQDMSLFSGVTKEYYFELKERMTAEVVTKEVIAQAAEPRDFGQCRDDCHNERNECFDRGRPTHVCEEEYDVCARECTENY